MVGVSLDYSTKGWVHLPNMVPQSQIDRIRDIGIEMRIDVKKYSDWKGIPCASRFSKDLYKFYTSDIMYTISQKYLGDTVYLFNDQIVVKLPHDTMAFSPHYDNQYGPDSNSGKNTINVSVILDDFTDDNGALSLKNLDDGQWITIYPKKGDLVAIGGNTYHKSGMNLTDSPRGLYACVYTDTPIIMENYYRSIFEKVICI